MGPIAIALVLVGIAGLLLALDLLLPSGGILLAMAMVSAAGSVLFGFRHSYQAGVWMLISELACVPLFAWLFVKLWPSTPFGKRMIIEPAKAKPYQWETDSMIGKTGSTTCDLAPTGQVEIDGRKWEATSGSGIIANGISIKVVSEEMGQLFVVPATSAATPDRSVPIASTFNKENSLDRPADDFGIDTL